MVTLDDIRSAAQRIKGAVHRTPLDPSSTFSALTKSDFYLKLENTQKTGSFKIRGATNKILQLKPAERKGVITASAGNHAQGVALAARIAKIPCTIVMPRDAPIQKIQATKGYGAEVLLHGRDYNEAFDKAREVQEERGLTFIHAFNDLAIIAGQGTIGLEIMEDLPDCDVVLTGIGGGGLIAGIATAVKGINPNCKVIGVQAEGAASAAKSFKQGRIVELERVSTIADGLATRRVGDVTFDIIKKKVDDVVTVTDTEIAWAVVNLLERAKVVSEGAGAVGLAACLAGKVDVEGRKVACLVSGGNIDLTLLDQIINIGLVREGRLFRFETVVDDKPGQLNKLLTILADERANVRNIWHERSRPGIGLTMTLVGIEVETRGPDHIDGLKRRLGAEGYKIAAD